MGAREAQPRKPKPRPWLTWAATTISSIIPASSSCSATVTPSPDRRRTTLTWACTGLGGKIVAARKKKGTKDCSPVSRIGTDFDLTLRGSHQFLPASRIVSIGDKSRLRSLRGFERNRLIASTIRSSCPEARFAMITNIPSAVPKGSIELNILRLSRVYNTSVLEVKKESPTKTRTSPARQVLWRS
jgi:hypothetical protein